jgi:hypothetical protein
VPENSLGTSDPNAKHPELSFDVRDQNVCAGTQGAQPRMLYATPHRKVKTATTLHRMLTLVPRSNMRVHWRRIVILILAVDMQ